MNVTKKLLVISSAAAAAAVTMVVPASANQADTDLHATITSGTLEISAPASFTYPSQALSASNEFNANIGATSVVDDRGNIGATWQATASSTAITDGATTVTAANVFYTTGTFSNTGSGTRTAEANNASLGSTTNTAHMTGGGPSTVSTWHPNVKFTVTAGTAGTYHGTLTQSVS